MRLATVVALALALPLAACGTQGGTTSDPHTGVSAKYSKQYSMASGLLSDLNGRASLSSATGYGVAVTYLTTGSGFSNFSQAWSFGKQLPYQPRERQLLGCGNGCSITESGRILLTKAEFEAAARTGFSFKLIGSGSSVEGTLPAAAFQEVLNP